MICDYIENLHFMTFRRKFFSKVSFSTLRLVRSNVCVVTIFWFCKALLLWMLASLFSSKIRKSTNFLSNLLYLTASFLCYIKWTLLATCLKTQLLFSCLNSKIKLPSRSKRFGGILVKCKGIVCGILVAHPVPIIHG